MASKLNNALIQNLRDLANNIAISQRLNDEAKEELYTHFEDKALEYLNDNEKLSDADILLLVREHFGNPDNLNQFLGGRSNHKRTGFVEDLLNCGWTKTIKDDFWGVFAFPWKQENRIPYTIYVFIECYLLIILPIILLLILRRLIPGWNHIFWSWIALLNIFWPLVALIISIVVYCEYRIIGSKVDKKKKLLRSSVGLQTEGIMVQGMLQSPAIFQYIDQQLIFTPLIGEQLVVPITKIKKVTISRNLNGSLLLGDNRYFKLEIDNDDRRLGFAVSHPETWKKILPVKNRSGLDSK